MLTIIMAVIAVALWVTAFIWAFHREVRRAWAGYRRRWTSDKP